MAIDKKDATKRKILEVSLYLFTQKGYGSTTIRDIAEAADISVGLLFHYFPAKSALLSAHLKVACAGIDSVEALLKSEASPLVALSSVAEITIDSFSQPIPRYLYLLVNQPLPPDSVARSLQKAIEKDRVISASIPLIEKGQALGEIRSGNSRALATVFWGAIQGTAELIADQPDAAVPDPNWIIDMLKK